MKINFKGSPVTLNGYQPKVLEEALNFRAVTKDLEEFELKNLKGKTIVLTTFPSIDTSVCSIQAARFNNEAKKFNDNVVLLTISRDLPFALGRHCQANGIENAIVVSDYKYREFGTIYSLVIEELELLARTVIIIDKEGIIRYVEILDEVAKEPNYEKALEVLKTL